MSMKTKREKAVITSLPESTSSREKSWITIGQIDQEFPEFIDKLADILYDKLYKERAKDYARSILTWLELWKFVSWKQFDSVWKICNTKEAWMSGQRDGFNMQIFRGVLNISTPKVTFTIREDHYPEMRKKLKMTDRELDLFHKKVFGVMPMFGEEEEGFAVKYRGDGSRYFTFPLDADMEFPVFL